MNDERIALRRLNRFLFILAAGMFIGTIAELLAAKHYEDTIQFVPFVLCGLGLLALGALKVRPNRTVIIAIRGLMFVIAAGSLFGVYEHVTGNLEFVHEVRRNADRMTVMTDTLQGGAPVLAPSVLAIGAIITLAASYTQRLVMAEPAPMVAQSNRATTPPSPIAHDRLFVGSDSRETRGSQI
jgi:hypothetical protein